MGYVDKIDGIGLKGDRSIPAAYRDPYTMAFDDSAGFLRSILADFEADGPRNVYSDWLEENGDLDRAEAIRLGVALRPWRKLDVVDVAEPIERMQVRLARIQAEHAARWAEALPKIPAIKWGDCNGGLFDEITILDAENFEENSEEILQAQPVVGFNYPWNPTREFLKVILEAPGMERLGASI